MDTFFSPQEIQKKMLREALSWSCVVCQSSPKRHFLSADLSAS